MKTSNGVDFRELSAIPGGYDAFRVYNSELMQGPYNLELGDIVEFQIRALNKAGWGEWNKQAVLEDKVVEAPTGPKFSATPPNGLTCVNSIWKDYQCVDMYGNPIS